MLQGQTAINALLRYLKNNNYYHKYEVNKEKGPDKGRLTRLFVALPSSIEHLKANHRILLLDATYKTNRFDMPLVNTASIDNCNNSFFISTGFLSGEAEDDYNWIVECNVDLWALACSSATIPQVAVTDADGALIKAIKAKLPTSKAFLCKWHVQKNVVKHCKAGFDTDEDWDKFEKAFNSILNATTKQAYEDRLLQFSITYAWEANPLFNNDYVKYIKETWFTDV